MNTKKFVFACGLALVIIGLSISCNKSSSPTAPATNGLVGVWAGVTSNYDSVGIVLTIKSTGFSLVRSKAKNGLVGVWTGATSRTGGGGCVKDDAGNCMFNTSGDTLWNYDSAGIVLTIKSTVFSLIRGNKTWGSSDYGRDSLKSAGLWAVMGNKAIFTPTTDSCMWKDETHPWIIDDGIMYSCLPPDTLTIDTTGNTWNTQIVNAKLAIYQQITLTKTLGSSDYGRDSLKSVGSWMVVGNKAIFTPTGDSCYWRNKTTPWMLDDGIMYSCLPPDTLTIDTTGNTWNTQIVSDKSAYQPITLVRQK
jgi:hypothetical protein